MADKPTDPGPGWLSTNQITATLDISKPHFYRKWKPQFADADMQRYGRETYYRGRAFLDLFAAQLAGEGQAVTDEAGDPLLASGGGSPALERYRERRADLADLELQERRRMLIPRDQIHQALGRLAGVMHDANDRLQREFGREAYAIIDEALEDFERGIGEELDGAGS